MSSEEKDVPANTEDVEMKAFLLSVLTDLTVTKNNIYNGRVFDAHRNVQKLSDKIKDKIGKL